MNYKVTFDIYFDNKTRGEASCIVEANNRKSAALRAMSEINKDDRYSERFKRVRLIEEVKNDGDKGSAV